MTARPAPALWLYAALALGGTAAGLLLTRPDLVAVAAAPALILLVGLATERDPRVRVVAQVERERLLEGEEVAITITVASDRPVEVTAELDLPIGLTTSAGTGRLAGRLQPGRPQGLTLRVRADRWGTYAVGSGVARTAGPAGLVVWETPFDGRSAVKVFPSIERLRSLVAPYRTQPTIGQRVARAAGEGIEFADLRPLQPGDNLRAVNWRATARRQTVITNQRHPERNADVVLFVDTFAEAGSDLQSTLDRQVRAAAAVAAALLRRRDRVGVIGFGGVLSWLRPGTGLRQWYRAVDALLTLRVVASEARKGIDTLPLRAVPAQALVLAVTPLLDERSVGAISDLRARGFDVAILEASPLRFTQRPTGEIGDLAWRLWCLEREMLRQRFRQAGVALAEWRDDVPLESVLAEVIAFRRAAQRSSA
jgi:uncharacterized protein (DUF58 family)